MGRPKGSKNKVKKFAVSPLGTAFEVMGKGLVTPVKSVPGTIKKGRGPKGSKNKTHKFCPIIGSKLPPHIHPFNPDASCVSGIVKRGRGRPKGSLNKPKTPPRTATIALGTTKSKGSEGCYVCGRVSWGPVQPLGLGQWRHAECYPGSPTWCHNFPDFDPTKISEAGNLLYVACSQQ